MRSRFARTGCCFRADRRDGVHRGRVALGVMLREKRNQLRHGGVQRERGVALQRQRQLSRTARGQKRVFLRVRRLAGVLLVEEDGLVAAAGVGAVAVLVVAAVVVIVVVAARVGVAVRVVVYERACEALMST